VLDERTLAIPDYDGNGMYRTWGNVLVNPQVGLLFLDFENPKRIRVNGTAQVREDDPLRSGFPGAVFVVRVAVELIFPNCPRYVHKMKLLEHSVYAPRPEYTPPVPAWKTFEAFRDALPSATERWIHDDQAVLLADELGHAHRLGAGGNRAPLPVRAARCDEQEHRSPEMLGGQSPRQGPRARRRRTQAFRVARSCYISATVMARRRACGLSPRGNKRSPPPCAGRRGRRPRWAAT
jgi:hypothetical protein